MKHRLIASSTAVIVAALVSACTVKKQEAPPLSGPSEFGLSITVNASPDVLALDGGSQSLVSITARDANSQPLRNLSLRAEIMVNFQPFDYGSLSARNLLTDSSGRATVVYTAPAGGTVDMGTVVTIAITPIGNEYLNTSPRFTSIRLVPPGSVHPPDGLQPHFSYDPESPTEGQSVRFEACYDPAAPCGTSMNPVTSYRWNFGDGTTAEGRVVNHAFRVEGSYLVTLEIGDAYGRTATTSETMTVGAGVAPTAAFIVIPTSPFVGQAATFDGTASRPSPGRTIRSYSWDFGDGDVKLGLTSPTTTHDFQTAGTFTVTLTVTDDLGKTAQTTQTITVRGDAPVADFTFSPPNPVAGTNVVFRSTSTAPPGRTIVSYFWTFGDGTTSTAAQPTKAFSTANSYEVTLGVTDSAGKTSTVTKTVVVR
jgi:PKD repeat protein